MKLSLVFVTVGLVAAVAACTSRDRTEVERTATITSAPMDTSPNGATATEPNVAAAPPATTTDPASAPVSGAVTPVTAPVAQASAAAAAKPTTTPQAATTRSAARKSDLIDRGQLVGPSLAPQQPIEVFPSGQQSSGSASHGLVESPSDFSPKPRAVAPTSTAGQITGFPSGSAF